MTNKDKEYTLKEYLDLMSDLGFPRAKLARQLEIAVSTLHRYETFKMEPSASMARKIIELSRHKISLAKLTDYWMGK